MAVGGQQGPPPLQPGNLAYWTLVESPCGDGGGVVAHACGRTDVTAEHGKASVQIQERRNLRIESQCTR